MLRQHNNVIIYMKAKHFITESAREEKLSII